MDTKKIVTFNQPYLISVPYNITAGNQNANLYAFRAVTGVDINNLVRSLQGFPLFAVQAEISVVRPAGASVLSVDRNTVNIQHYYGGFTRETFGANMRGQYNFRSDSELLFNFGGIKDLEFIPAIATYNYAVYIDLLIQYQSFP